MTIKTASLATGELMGASDQDPPKEFRIFKSGHIKSRNGNFEFSKQSVSLVEAKAKEFGNDFSIDYGHAMFSPIQIDPAESGKAAGWFKAEIRGDELWATDVSWTANATKKLKEREFRYISPVFNHKQSGEIVELLNVALTNVPATHELRPLMASTTIESPTPQESEMLTKFIIAKLGLKSDASEAEVVAALEIFLSPVAQLSTLTGKSNTSEMLGTVAAWKQGSETVAALQAKVAELETTNRDTELNALIEQGKRDKKINVAMEPVLRQMGKTDISSVKAFLQATSAITPTEVKEPGEKPGMAQLSSDDEKVAKMMGIDPVAVAKAKEARAGRVPTGKMKEDETKE